MFNQIEKPKWVREITDNEIKPRLSCLKCHPVLKMDVKYPAYRGTRGREFDKLIFREFLCCVNTVVENLFLSNLYKSKLHKQIKPSSSILLNINSTWCEIFLANICQFPFILFEAQLRRQKKISFWPVKISFFTSLWIPYFKKNVFFSFRLTYDPACFFSNIQIESYSFFTTAVYDLLYFKRI